MDSRSFSVFHAPNVWQRLESVPAGTLASIDQCLEFLARRLSEEGDSAATIPRFGTHLVDGHIAVYEIDAIKKRITLTAVMRCPNIVSP